MFYDLSANRQIVDNIIGRISYTEIQAYIQLYGIYNISKFLDCISMMDVAYVEATSEKLRNKLLRLKDRQRPK